MKNIKKYITVIILLISSLTFAQIPCTSGFEANGANDFISIPNTDAINLQNTRNRTVEFWFNPSDINSRQVLYEEGAQVNAILFYIEGGRVYVGGYRNNANNAGNRRFFRSALDVIEVNKWSHIAFSIEDTNSPDITFKWFLDGVEQDSRAGLQINTHSGNVSIGRNGGVVRYPVSLTDADWGGNGNGTYTGNFTGNDGDDNNFDGNISLLRIWNVARTQTEINDNKSSFLSTGTDLVAYQNGDEMEYEANGATTISATATANGSATEYVWTGLTSTRFLDVGNWTNSTTPDISKTQKVTINNGTFDPSIGTEVKIGRLTVDSGVEFIVENGATLNVFYELTNNGTITVEDGGALIFHSCNTTIAGTGTFNIKRTTPTYSNNYFYSYWSTPVIESNATPNTIFPDSPVIYSYNSSSSNSDWISNGTTNFKPGVGYAVRSENTGGQLRTFSGKINEGDVKVNVYFTDNVESEDVNNIWSTKGDNLVGNPYASAIDWDLIVADTDNSNIEGTVYFWNQNTAETGDNNVSDYLQYNSTGGASKDVTGKIGTGQGFFVRTKSNGEITFKTTHQVVADNNQFFRGSNNNKKQGRSWFTFSNGKKTNTLLVGFVKGATNRNDRLFDAPFDINQKSLGFYSLIKGKEKVSIQGLPKLKRDKKVVKLGFIVDEIGDYSIGIQDEYIDEDYYIYLRDKEKKITVDLKQTKYNFTIDSIGENNTRFKIIYTKNKRRATQTKEESSIVTEIDSKDFSVYIDDAKELIVEYDYDEDNVKEVALYNIQGQKVAYFKDGKTKDVSNLRRGVYIVNAILKDKRVFNKKIIISF